MDLVQSIEALTEQELSRLKGWVALNQTICESLGVDWEDWIVRYISQAAARTGDYSFLQTTEVGRSNLKAAGLAQYLVKQVAKPNRRGLGVRASLKEVLADFISGSTIEPTKLKPADVAATKPDPEDSWWTEAARAPSGLIANVPSAIG